MTYGHSSRQVMAEVDMTNLHANLKHPLSNFLSYNVLYIQLYNNLCDHHEFWVYSYCY